MNKKEANTEEYAALIGLDWAAEKHDVCLWDAATGKSRHRVIEHTPEALAEWLAELQACYPGQRLAVCLEQSRGALMYALMGHAFLDLYPINPVTLARYREAFAPSRARTIPATRDCWRRSCACTATSSPSGSPTTSRRGRWGS